MRSRSVACIAFSLLLVFAGLPGASAQSGDATLADQWVVVDYDVAITDALDRLRLTGSVEIHEFSTEGEPALRSVCGSSCSADEARDAYQQGGTMEDRIVNTIEQEIETQTEQALRSLGGGGQAQVTATVDEASLQEPAQGDAFEPPVPVDVEGSAPLVLVESANYTQTQKEALFRMGARVTIPFETPVERGTDMTLSLAPPSPLTVLDAPQGTIAPDQTSVTWQTNNLDATNAATLRGEPVLGHGDVQVPRQERMDVRIVMDLSNIDIHYFDAITGGTPASLTAALTVNATIRSIQAPNVTEGVELAYLSADAIRIGLEHDIIQLQQITRVEDEARSAIRSAFRTSFGEAVPVSGGLVPSSLEPTKIGTPAGTGSPVYLDLGAETEMPIPPEGSGPLGNETATAGIEITRVPAGTIELPQIPTPGNRSSNVTILLPPGLGLDYESINGGNLTTSQTEEGKTAITFTSSGQQDGQAPVIQGAELVIEHPLIWHLFWPVILLLILLLIVLPGVLIGRKIYNNRREEEDAAKPPPSPEPESDADGPASEPEDAEA